MLAPMLNRRHTLLSLATVLGATPTAHAQAMERPRSRRPPPDDPAATDLRWTDPRRQRELPLRLRLPAGNGPVPLVLFSHGLGGSVAAGTLWAQAWLQAGFACLHLQHPGSDTEALRALGWMRLRQAASGQQLIDRAADVGFVLDELARRQAEFARLRLDAVGLAGHSFGAHTALAVAGQRYPQGGAAPLADTRLRAFAAFSPTPGTVPNALAGVQRPVLCLTGSLDDDPFAEPGSPRHGSGAYRRGAFDGLPSGNKAELWLDAADHLTFGGQELPAGAMRRNARAPETLAQNERHRALITTTSTDWWRAHLLDDGAARQRLAQTPAGLGPQDAWRTA
jgi:dienelactone hydrolase